MNRRPKAHRPVYLPIISDPWSCSAVTLLLRYGDVPPAADQLPRSWSRVGVSGHAGLSLPLRRDHARTASVCGNLHLNGQCGNMFGSRGRHCQHSASIPGFACCWPLGAELQQVCEPRGFPGGRHQPHSASTFPWEALANCMIKSSLGWGLACGLQVALAVPNSCG